MNLVRIAENSIIDLDSDIEFRSFTDRGSRFNVQIIFDSRGDQKFVGVSHKIAKEFWQKLCGFALLGQSNNWEDNYEESEDTDTV